MSITVIPWDGPIVNRATICPMIPKHYHVNLGIFNTKTVENTQMINLTSVSPLYIRALELLGIQQTMFVESKYEDIYVPECKHYSLLPLFVLSDNVEKYRASLNANTINCNVDFALDHEWTMQMCSLDEHHQKFDRIITANMGTGYTYSTMWNDGYPKQSICLVRLSNGDMLSCCYFEWFNK